MGETLKLNLYLHFVIKGLYEKWEKTRGGRLVFLGYKGFLLRTLEHKKEL